jgi:iron-sulfur cluster assembly accessory protein
MIEITEAAANYINQKSENKGFRLSVTSSGCNGHKYKWDINNATQDGDIVIFGNNASVVIDKMSYVYVQECVIDLESDVFNKTLKIVNPQVKHTCGCGESFSF